MWKIKACPRCNGDLYMEKEIDGWYESCLQCGHRREMEELHCYKNVKQQVHLQLSAG
jgi:hypothetical protein